MDVALAIIVAGVVFWAAAKAIDLLLSALLAVALFVVIVGLDGATMTLQAVRSWLAP